MTNLEIAERLVHTCREKGITLASAESCTGGMLAALITDIAGVSDVFPGGFVAYANHMKKNILGVPVAILKTHSAVSSETARAMAEGARTRARATIAVSITGISGPGGGTAEKPVGLVHMAVAYHDDVRARAFNFKGTRKEVRDQSVRAALLFVEEALAL